jgi:anthranilate/para-aminobenzoate synthase component II
MTAITLIDNYDSFTWNLVHCLGRLGAEVIEEPVGPVALLVPRQRAVAAS